MHKHQKALYCGTRKSTRIVVGVNFSDLLLWYSLVCQFCIILEDYKIHILDDNVIVLVKKSILSNAVPTLDKMRSISDSALGIFYAAEDIW